MKKDKNAQENEQIQELQNTISQLEGKVSENNDKYLRAIADYQNLARQTEAWKLDFVAYSNVNLIVKLLEALDDLQKAQENLKDNGLGLVVNKFKKILENEGLVELDLLGKDYDPNLSEVISMEPGEKDNVITRVLQTGYKLKDRVIRPAKVVVSKIN